MSLQKDQRIAALEADGFVVMRAKSYRQAHQRQLAAEAEARWAREEMESSRRWAKDCLNEERRLRDRCEFLYGEAIRHGASMAELMGSR